MGKTLQICFFIVFLLQGCRDNSHPEGYKVNLSGLGASFTQIFYDVVTSGYIRETKNKVIYNETSTGSGIRAFKDRVVDFIVVGTFLGDEEINVEDVLHIPCSLSAIVLIFNIPEVEELNLNPPVIAGIYLGKIKHWDDVRIAAINPGIKLPNLPIVPVSRSDGSGTTHLFSCYLSRTDDEWKKQIGTGKYLKSMHGIAVKGNSAVANTVKNLQGAIGYISMEHAAILNLPVAAIQNACGHFVKADKHSLHYLADVELPDDMRMILADSGQENAYPIPCLSWILVYRNQNYNHRSAERYEALKSFLHYVISPKTQKLAGRLMYVPLPANVIEKAKNLVESMERIESERL